MPRVPIFMNPFPNNEGLLVWTVNNALLRRNDL
jgi:hypothetical protein